MMGKREFSKNQVFDAAIAKLATAAAYVFFVFTICFQSAARADVPPAEEILRMAGSYEGYPYCAINGDVPYFTKEEITDEGFEEYGELDSLGRCTYAFACVGNEMMPTSARESISSVTPTGWKNVQYAGIDQGWLWNRCHLIGFQLTGENANERNLITGTRYMNVDGMLPFEDSVSGYVRVTDKHVMYRVTPVFDGDNLVASGVLMEGLSVEDDSIQYCIFCYNVQPGVEIDYRTGDSSGEEYKEPEEKQQKSTDGTHFVINANSGKYHLDTCKSVKDIADKNRMEYTGKAEDLDKMGYVPCKSCHPDGK